MLITLHCGGMPFDGTTIEERSLGGSESAAYYLARELAKNDHRVTMFTNTETDSETDGVRYVPAGQVSDQFPLGEMFHYYASNTPCDILIIQRHPLAFSYEWASKINLWWTHDLALVSNKHLVENQMRNIDGVLTVSQWHADQIAEVYGLNPDIIYPITNGVDLSLFEGEIVEGDYSDNFKMLFSSRPERGLENLVRPGGIMERLLESKSEAHLFVCAYDNVTPHMKAFYEALHARCKELPNVTVMGALTKQELADVMRQMDLHIMPTTFEETSCITSMETMAAGLPLLACGVGALPETTAGSGTELIPLTDNKVNEDLFVQEISSISEARLGKMKGLQLKKAPFYSWEKAAERLEHVFARIIELPSLGAKLKHLILTSDYYAARSITPPKHANHIVGALYNELGECYSFTNENIWDEHYKAYYAYEKDRGVNYGPENLENNHRYLHVAGLVSNLDPGSTVLDYGCAHGHYTVNLAKSFPELNFIGVDITESNIIKARDWAESEGVGNVQFFRGRVDGDRIKDNVGGVDVEISESLDCVIAAEVLEHVPNPGHHVDVLQSYLREGGTMIVTTPYGEWEAIGYKEHWPWRAHVYHFERQDLQDLWGHNSNFNVVNVPSGRDHMHGVVGSYITTWTNGFISSQSIDMNRKLNTIVPRRQTISCCMIVKDAPVTIRRCLESIMPYVDELIIGFDEGSKEETQEIADKYTQEFWPEIPVTFFEIESPTVQGFDAARNKTIEKASGDWILWIDADEYLHNGDLLHKYLRNNQFNGYAVNQHHFSMEPVGVIKTDMPVRVFRNHKGITFKGIVHEHPEKTLNGGVGHVTLLEGISILHDGYTDERTRRGRFDRNIDLLIRDRKENPERILGKFLWIRDLAQMCQWELENNGGRITETMFHRADEGIKLWSELLEEGDVRIMVDSLDYYSTLSRIKGEGFEMDLRFDTSIHGEARAETVRPVHAYFHTKDHASRLMNAIFEERTKSYGGKYS